MKAWELLLEIQAGLWQEERQAGGKGRGFSV